MRVPFRMMVYWDRYLCTGSAIGKEIDGINPCISGMKYAIMSSTYIRDRYVMWYSI